MTIQEARAAIGQPFKWMLCYKWDVIREVTDDGYIIGDFLTAHVIDCRLKQEQPEWLKKYINEKDNTKT